MKATEGFVKEKFDEFNKLIFNNKLPNIPIKIGKAKTQLGSISYKKRTTINAINYYDLKLIISSCYDLQENELEDIIIHEMIHYYILHLRINDTSPHGRIFQEIMQKINSRFGRNITISKRQNKAITEDAKITNSPQRQHIICTAEIPDGQHVITVIAKSRIFAFWELLPNLFKLRNVKWYVCIDKYFDRFPKCIKPKLYIADTVTLDHLNNAKELINSGNRIILKKL